MLGFVGAVLKFAILNSITASSLFVGPISSQLGEASEDLCLLIYFAHFTIAEFICIIQHSLCAHSRAPPGDSATRSPEGAAKRAAKSVPINKTGRPLSGRAEGVFALLAAQLPPPAALMKSAGAQDSISRPAGRLARSLARLGGRKHKKSISSGARSSTRPYCAMIIMKAEKANSMIEMETRRAQLPLAHANGQRGGTLLAGNLREFGWGGEMQNVKWKCVIGARLAGSARPVHS